MEGDVKTIGLDPGEMLPVGEGNMVTGESHYGCFIGFNTIRWARWSFDRHFLIIAKANAFRSGISSLSKKAGGGGDYFMQLPNCFVRTSAKENSLMLTCKSEIHHESLG